MSRGFLAMAVVFLFGCDKSGPLSDRSSEAVSVTPVAPPPAADAGGAPSTSHRIMAPRPVPTTSPTVLITMPQDVQLQAIQYMAAMQAPQTDDAPADPAFAGQIAAQLRAVGKTDVVSNGRRIDLVLDKGCDATLPREAIARHTGSSLTTLLAHGVLVVRCADRSVQCLQSTRDATDVLCTHK